MRLLDYSGRVCVFSFDPFFQLRFGFGATEKSFQGLERGKGRRVMGIQGLLPQLKSIMQPIHVQDLCGQTVAVDTYSWLHKGAVSCSFQLCKGIPTTKHINYCMHRVKLLQHHGVKPILVFDGGLLPMKIDQETKRARKRKENLERALEHEAAGNSSAAFDCYQKAVDISPSIAFELIQVLKQENVDFVVAPYEADAQMTFLSMYNHVDAVITEDSDLIPFGCSRIIFKMDKFGQGVEFRSSLFEQNRDLDLTGFTKQMILEMCIFSGCDYLPSLPGMGLKRAHALVRKYKSYEKVTKHLRYSGVSVPPVYEGSFKKAVWAFQHQRVYNPEKECIMHLSDVPQDIGEDLDFLGPWLPPDVVKGIAKGDLDPLTKGPFQVETESSTLAADKAFPMKNSETIDRIKKLELPVQKNILTNYFCLASIQAKRKFMAPKFTPKLLMEPSSPRSSSPDSDSRGSDEAPLFSATGQSQDSQHKSGCSNNKLPVEDGLPNKCNSFLGLPLNGRSVNKRCPSPFLESYQAAVNPKSHEVHETELKHTTLEIKSMNRNLRTSRFFSNNSLLEVASREQIKVSSKNKEDGTTVVLHDPMVSLGEPIQNFQETSKKKRKTIHLFDKNERETLPPGTVKSNPVLADEDNEDENRNGFGRDISHVNDYCGIAEKSMERFVSLINSFRYNPSGSRASGLRPPLKDVRNTCSMRSNNAPVDFSKFAYKPRKNTARIVSSKSKFD
ncbi:exonuclease 1-like isoform X2 [Phalaenopsis equestris]|uniref:exonuclease 1-like isoform X2 n=1 Tax=Phalaenopsis equestris TaxID=78828 RepID=UPI0009E5BF3E|nr:exonuclease 1-like isoform X2 [Phalaenopsis equestris]